MNLMSSLDWRGEIPHSWCLELLRTELCRIQLQDTTVHLNVYSGTKKFKMITHHGRDFSWRWLMVTTQSTRFVSTGANATKLGREKWFALTLKKGILSTFAWHLRNNIQFAQKKILNANKSSKQDSRISSPYACCKADKALKTNARKTAASGAILYQ